MDRFLAQPTTPAVPRFTPEQYARYFYTAVEDDNGDSTGRWTCRVCMQTYRQADGRGWTNLIAHLRARHSDYDARMRAALEAAEDGRLPWVSQRARQYHPSPAFAHDAQANILRLTETVEAKIAAEMPDAFGLIFDGWTYASEHFLAVYATYEVDGCVLTPLLLLAPIINEPDEDLSAAQHKQAFIDVLEVFGKEISHVAFLVGDICSVNKKLAALVGRPLVGCASHGLNLAVKKMLSSFSSELDSIQQLMIKLRTLKQSAMLRTPLRPVIRQDTRWSSTFSMPLRFFEIREFLNGDDDGIAELIPTAAVTKKLKNLIEKLKNVESVSKRLQTHSTTMWEARILLDGLIEDFPAFASYVGPNAGIVAAPAFETAIVKLQSGRSLLRSERLAVSHLRVMGTGTAAHADDDVGYAERVLKRARIAKRAEQYKLVNAVVPTSNVVERLFSIARACIGLGRHSLQPIMLEAMLFLKINRTYWNVTTVHETLAA